MRHICLYIGVQIFIAGGCGAGSPEVVQEALADLKKLMVMTMMLMIKEDKEAVDKEMTQGATAHLVSLPSSPLDTPCPAIVYKIFLLCTNSIVY